MKKKFTLMKVDEPQIYTEPSQTYVNEGVLEEFEPKGTMPMASKNARRRCPNLLSKGSLEAETVRREH